MGLLIAGMIGLIGCGGAANSGPKLYSVTGKVTFSGEPLKEGDLVVRSVDGKHGAGSKITDGQFTLKAPAGAFVVEITAMRDVPGEFREENPGEKVAVREQFIPSKYNSETSLKMDIQPQSKELKFELTP
jgi:hypothetical protein